MACYLRQQLVAQDFSVMLQPLKTIAPPQTGNKKGCMSMQAISTKPWVEFRIRRKVSVQGGTVE